MKKTGFAALAIGLVLLACNPRPIAADDGAKIVAALTYVKDRATGLCFGVGAASGGPVVVVVPDCICAPLVEKP